MYQCPQCHSEYGYDDGQSLNCPECGHTWTEDSVEETEQIVDSVGNPLQNGDAVTIIKDLKLGKNTLKRGTKAKQLQILDEPVNGHILSAKFDSYGVVYLRPDVVKKN